MKKALLNYSKSELKELVGELGEPAFRAGQIYSWLTRCVPFEEMSNLSKALRARLAESFTEGYARIDEVQVSSDGTRKYLLEMGDKSLIESVLMKYEYGNTVCISTQAGCAMNCAFCASCRGGLVRNLSAGEILSQVLAINADLGEGRSITNIVLMGTGEPLANYDNVMKFLRLINSPDSLGISYRNISLSTCGIVPAINRFCEEGIPVTLCLSLHAAFDEKRRRLMPIAQKYDLKETLAAFRRYGETTGRRVIFEYLLIGGFNDTHEDARQLKRLLSGMSCHINLIPYNEVEEAEFSAPAKGRVYSFMEELTGMGLSATVRRSLGRDIDGACGQLRAKRMKERD